MRAILEDLAGTAPQKAAAVVQALPAGFPAQFVDPAMAAIAQRAGLMGDTTEG